MANQEADSDDADEAESSIQWADAISDGELLVVSNRQPYSHGYDGDTITVDEQAGGLTAGLDPVMQAVGGTWIAWGDGEADREVVDGNDCVPAPPDDPSYSLRRVWLSEAEVDDYYYGFSNRVLWPICHSALTNVEEEDGYWDRYRTVNERFVDAVVSEATDDAIIWFQDYHFSLAPSMVRDRLDTDAVILHFWHIPWPSWDTFRACPHGHTIIEGLLGNDLLAFHVPRYRKNFLEGVDAAIPDATVDYEGKTVTYRNHVTRVTEFPMGVPVGAIEQRAQTDEAASYWEQFKESHDIADTVAVGVDRLDYTKGIPERLQALELFWERNPEWRGELSFVQNGSESRSQIDAYQDIQAEITEAVDRINDRFGTDDWTPVVEFRDYISQEALAGLYRNGDLALISPVRDGMNLVAHEYVAAQVDNDGVLVLSNQTGAENLLDGAITITPQDTGAFADAIETALSVPGGERRARMAYLHQQVRENDLAAWTERNLRAALALRDGESGKTQAGSLVGGEP